MVGIIPSTVGRLVFERNTHFTLNAQKIYYILKYLNYYIDIMDDEITAMKNVRVVYIATKHDRYNNEQAYFKI